MTVYEDISPTFLSLALRALITQPDEDQELNQFILGRWFPLSPNFLPGTEFKFTDKASLRTFTEAMPARALDAEIRLKGRTGTQTKAGQMAYFGEGYVVTETDMVLQAAARVGADNAEVANNLEEVFDDLGAGYRAFRARMEIIYAELIRLGTITIAENGIEPEAIDFGRNASNTHTVSVAWSNVATAAPFAEERIALNYMRRNQGLRPQDLVVLTSENTYQEWASTTAVKEAHPTVRVSTEVSDTELQELRRRHRLPEIVIYDASAEGYGSGSQSQLMPDGDWVYVPRDQPLGATQLGTPPATLMPVLNQVAAAGPGPIAYLDYEINPAQMTTIVDFAGLPVEYDPDATYRMVV